MDKWERVQSKIQSLEQLKAQIESWKKEGKSVVFTNGCFDILHRGHVTYLAKAASLGDYLVVAVNNDESVRKQNKGANRPINDQDSRLLVLASLGVVDAVVIFEQETPKDIITLLSPSILVKGADYDASETEEDSKKYIVGSKEVLASGGIVKTISLEEGFSTTRIIEKINR